jgi:hypothetical protein
LKTAAPFLSGPDPYNEYAAARDSRMDSSAFVMETVATYTYKASGTCPFKQENVFSIHGPKPSKEWEQQIQPQ